MSKSKYPHLNDEQWLYQKYWIEELSIIQIAEIVGCCNTAVYKALKRLQIPVKTKSEAHVGKHHSEATKRKIAETKEGKKNPNYGKRPSEETRQKLSEASRGRKHSEETKCRMSEWHKNHPISEEHRQKITEALKGKLHSEETKQKIANSLKGRIFSKEHKQKLSEAGKGKKLSDETKKKIATSHRGKKLSEEHKRKIGDAEKGEKNANYGKPRSAETKRKIAEGRKGKYTGENNPFFGKHHTEATKQKLRETRKCQKFPTHRTKPELVFESICKKYNLPFRYTGDGAIWIGKGRDALNPDFMHLTKKIVVEVFGWHHNELQRHCKVRYSQTYEGRKKILKKYGYKMIVFWQEDLVREDTEKFILSMLRKEKIISL